MKNKIITVDGPAGSGKGRIAKYIADKWKLFHLDSGILYRRLSCIIIKNKRLSHIKSLKDIYPKVMELQKKGICYLVKNPFQKIPNLYDSNTNKSEVCRYDSYGYL